MADSKASTPTASKQPKKDKKKGGSRPDLGTIIGLTIGIGGIVVGLMMEGGKIQDVAQVTAGLIVMGGTLGAVMVTNPLSVVIRAAKQAGCLFMDPVDPVTSTIEELIDYATIARKQGIVSLEQKANTIADPFLKKALNLAIDGVDMDQIRSMMELEITVMEQNSEAEAKVFEAAGGYSPTIGIIGAVLGLIQVMKNLANIDEVGRGIAVAFVATVYGVASANLFLLPAAGKLRARMRRVVRLREMMLEGVLSISEGLNQKLIRTKLDAFAQDLPKPAKPRQAKNEQVAAQALAAEG
jgi:chemotaxis protein MotA